jgi:hypothetical protein
MAVEKSYARLGLFLVVVLVVVLATALLFIQRWRSRAVIEAVTYTTENVSGLEISSPVRFRGVSIGRVSEVRVDPRDVIVDHQDSDLVLQPRGVIEAVLELVVQDAPVEALHLLAVRRERQLYPGDDGLDLLLRGRVLCLIKTALNVKYINSPINITLKITLTTPNTFIPKSNCTPSMVCSFSITNFQFNKNRKYTL